MNVGPQQKLIIRSVGKPISEGSETMVELFSLEPVEGWERAKIPKIHTGNHPRNLEIVAQ